jgi:hypothetical protein
MPKPYTVRFGPWLPDITNVGVEMPYQWSDTELPVADCQNVYWQDGAYRCLPGLSSIGPTLGTPILSCFTWYDNTQSKEIVFAATANGFFQLEDGVWTQIPVQQNASAGTVGFAINIGLGSPTGLATAMSPTSESATQNSASYTFPALTAVIGYGSASSYNWYFTGQSGTGTWSIASGQGTSSASPAVSGTVANATTTVTCNCDITFGGHVYMISGSLSYTQNPPLLRSYTSGSGTETMPSGYAYVDIEVKGGGGGWSTTGYTQSFAAGGGGAGYCRSTNISVVAGGTLNYAVGNAGGTDIHENGTSGIASSVSSGTVGITTMTANGGGGGFSNGAGGTASGGNAANATGANGVNGGAGGASTAGVNFDAGNAYGHGGTYNSGGSTGGFVVFYYHN